MRKKKLEAQIRYEENCSPLYDKEVYAIYLRNSGGEWGFSTAYPIKDDRVNRSMIEKIRELMLLGYEISWK